MKYRLAFAAVGLVALACEAPPTGPQLMLHDGPLVFATSGRQAGSCTFERGVTTCVSSSQVTETATHDVFSGCIAGPPPFTPGRRVTTVEDTYVVRTTVTTQQHGRNGRIFDERTDVERLLQSSRELSSVCEKIN